MPGVYSPPKNHNINQDVYNVTRSLGHEEERKAHFEQNPHAAPTSFKYNLKYDETPAFKAPSGSHPLQPDWMAPPAGVSKKTTAKGTGRQFPKNGDTVRIKFRFDR